MTERPGERMVSMVKPTFALRRSSVEICRTFVEGGKMVASLGDFGRGQGVRAT